jgi:hypothetical protein
MKKIIGIGSVFALAAMAAIAGTRYAFESDRPKNATRMVSEAGNLSEAVSKGFASCPVANATGEKITVAVISSKFSGGTYYVEPLDRALLSCGDEVRIVGKDFSKKLKLSMPITVKVLRKEKGVEI